MAMVSYMTVGSNDLEKAKAFYDELLGSIGMKPIFEHPSGGRLYSGKGMGMFGVLGPYDKKPATVGNGTMGGFRFDTAEEMAAFHAKALSLGGTNEGDPGPRTPNAHFAYFRDPDGNKLCGYFFG
jgi:catechol 2,3-dioxygenase-like lactoylglutathione lyase family enzyme